MKTKNCKLLGLLATSAIALTLTACGGGGGGGGGNETAQPPAETVTGYAPYNLAYTTMTYTNGQNSYSFTFSSGGQVEGYVNQIDTRINYTGTYSYSRSDDGQSAILKLNTSSGTTSAGITRKQNFEFTLSFSSTTQANATVSYAASDSVDGSDFWGNEQTYVTTATFSGAGVLEDNTTNEPPPTDSAPALAPEALTTGKVFNTHNSTGTISSYTLTSASTCTTESGSKLTYEYTKESDTTAKITTVNGMGIVAGIYELTFTSTTEGTYICYNAGGNQSSSGSFNISDKVDATPSTPEADNSTPEAPNTPQVQLGTAPDKLDGYVIQVETYDGDGSRYYITMDDELYIKRSFRNSSTGYYSGDQYIHGHLTYTPSADRKTARLYMYTPEQWIGVQNINSSNYMNGYQQKKTQVVATIYFDAAGQIYKMEGTFNNSTLNPSKCIGVPTIR